jgi:hypothetical protein
MAQILINIDTDSEERLQQVALVLADLVALLPENTHQGWVLEDRWEH